MPDDINPVVSSDAEGDFPDPTTRRDGTPATYKQPPPPPGEWGPWTDPRPHVHYMEEIEAGFERPADWEPPTAEPTVEDNPEDILVKALKILKERGLGLEDLIPVVTPPEHDGEQAIEQEEDSGS